MRSRARREPPVSAAPGGEKTHASAAKQGREDRGGEARGKELSIKGAGADWQILLLRAEESEAQENGRGGEIMAKLTKARSTRGRQR